jgi:tetratricopeptide (TPR) repeat protein
MSMSAPALGSSASYTNLSALASFPQYYHPLSTPQRVSFISPHTNNNNNNTPTPTTPISSTTTTTSFVNTVSPSLMSTLVSLPNSFSPSASSSSTSSLSPVSLATTNNTTTATTMNPTNTDAAATAAVQLTSLRRPIIPAVYRPPLPSSRSTPSLTSLDNTLNPLHIAPPQPQTSLRHSSELCRIGNAFFSQHEYNVAIAIYTQALELNPADVRAWNNRGTAYVAQKLFKMGIRDYTEAIILASDVAELYYKRGVAYSALKSYNQAIEDYTRCLEKNPKFADALNNRGNAFRIIHHYTLAKQDLEQALVLDPKNELYLKNLKKINDALAAEPMKHDDQNLKQKEMERNVMQSVLQSKLNIGARNTGSVSGNGGFDLNRNNTNSVLSPLSSPSLSPTTATNEQIISYLQRLSPESIPSLIHLLSERVRTEKTNPTAATATAVGAITPIPSPQKTPESHSIATKGKRSREYIDCDSPLSNSEEDLEDKDVIMDSKKKIKSTSPISTSHPLPDNVSISRTSSSISPSSSPLTSTSTSTLVSSSDSSSSLSSMEENTSVSSPHSNVVLTEFTQLTSIPQPLQT